MSAREQVTRLLALVPYLNARDEVSLDQAAADFGVTTSVLLRDLNVLWFCGLPGLGPGDLIDIDMEAFAEEGDGKIRLANADYLARPLRLGSSEASALLVALRAMRESSAEESRGAIDRTLAKLEAATADGQAGEVVEVPGTVAATAPTARALAAAVDGGRQVRLGYWVPSRDETTERVVDPLALLDADGHRYLDAWCHLAEARRLFRLDRVTSWRCSTRPPWTTRSPLATCPRGSSRPGPDDELATVRLQRPARWVAEYYPVEATTELAGGELEVSLRVGDTRWLVRLMLRLAPYAELVAPADLAEEVRSAATSALALYSERPTTRNPG